MVVFMPPLVGPGLMTVSEALDIADEFDADEFDADEFGAVTPNRPGGGGGGGTRCEGGGGGAGGRCPLVIAHSIRKNLAEQSLCSLQLIPLHAGIGYTT